MLGTGYVDISDDGGNSWHRIHTWVKEDTPEFTWVTTAVDLSDYNYNIPDLKIRFGHEAPRRSHIYFDAIEVYGAGQPDPVTVTLLDPADHSTTPTVTPLLSWSSDHPADYYNVIVDDHADFSSPAISDSNVTLTHYDTSGSLDQTTTYYWKVRAYAGNTWWAWSTVWSFTTPESAANAVLVQAEDYDEFYDTTTNNVGMMYRFDDVDIEPSYDLSFDGTIFFPGYLYGHDYNNGFRVNSISNSEWLKYYINIPTTDRWKFTFRMARLPEGLGSFDFEIDDQPVTGSPFTINSTGHHHIFQDIVVPNVDLAAGSHVVKVTFHGEAYDMAEFDWFYIESETNPPEPLVPTPKDYGPPPPPPQGYVSPVSRYGRLQVNGVEITSSATGNPVQLRGVSPHGTQWFPTIDNHTIPNYAYDVGAQITRVPMYVEQFGGYTYGPTAKAYMLAKTDEMIQDAIDVGIYASVSFHVHVDPSPYTSEAIEFFTHVANEWGGHPNVIYEIVNESDGGTWAPIKNFADQVVPVIRDIETANGWEHNLIIVGTPTWCQRPDLAVGNPIDDVNIAYTFHWYAAGHPNSLWENIDTTRNAGLCIIVSEWGTGSWNWASPDYDLYDSEAFINFLDQRGISWINWAWNIKGEALSSLQWTSSMQGPWPDGDLTPSGVFVKEEINAPPYVRTDMDVFNIDLTCTRAGGPFYKVVAEGMVRDENGNPVSDVIVNYTWTGAPTSSGSVTTDGSGMFTVDSPKVKGGGTFVFSVASLVRPGYADNDTLHAEPREQTSYCP